MIRQTAKPDAALIRLLQEAQAVVDQIVARLCDRSEPYTDLEAAFML